MAGTKDSLIERGDTQRSRFMSISALSFVQLARAPPRAIGFSVICRWSLGFAAAHISARLTMPPPVAGGRRSSGDRTEKWRGSHIEDGHMVLRRIGHALVGAPASPTRRSWPVAAHAGRSGPVHPSPV